MTETETELSNILAFPAPDETDPRERVNYLLETDGEFCLHPGYLVNEKERTVRCKKCQALIDPFALLLKIATKETNLATGVAQLRAEERERRQNIERLIQVERNAKARIRRLEGKR